MSSLRSMSQSLIYIQTILEEKGEALAAGTCRLTLTASLTQEICTHLYSSNRGPDGARLRDLFGNVRAVRIDPEARGSSIAQSVYLSPFHNLTYLEVRYVDVFSLVHLSKLRSQLKHLVLYSCVNSLDDVLLRCGGDKCLDSFLWTELHSLHVTSCDCLELDGALHLAPWLKRLDLSFNSLSDHAVRSLDTLFSINHLSLNFNRLLKVPTLAPSARSSLKILHLRQNQLENLKGLEHLCSLEELDLAYNCITNQDAVLPLSSLPYLVTLCLEFNPISFSKDYRTAILQRVSTAVSKKKFKLDGRLLTDAEKDAVGTLAVIFPLRPSQSGPNVDRYQPRSEPECDVVIHVVESTPQRDEKQLSGNHTPEFSSIDAPNSAKLLSSGSKSSSSSRRRKGVRTREAEIMDSNLQPPADADDQIDSSPQIKSSDCEHLATKQRLEELRRTFGQEHWLHSQAGDQVRQLLGWNEQTPQPAGTENPLQSDGARNGSEGKNDDQSSDGNGDAREESIEVLPSSRSSFEADGEAEEEEEEAVDHVFVVDREVDGVLLERLLAVSKWILSEKDVLSGSTLSSWKIAHVKSARILDRGTRIRFQLKFSPASKSCQERVYLMEENDYSEFESLISNAVGSFDEEAEVDHLRCMKCDQEFPRKCAAVKLRTVSNVTSNLKGHLEEYLVCPGCGSDMIFAVEPENRPASENRKAGAALDESSKSDPSSGESEGEARADSSGRSANSGDSEVSVEVVDKTNLYGESPAFSKSKNGSSVPLFAISKSLKSIESSRSLSSQSSQSKSTRQSSIQTTQSTAFSYSYADFTQVDHRLRLYCEMFLTSHEAEEFMGLIRVELVTSLEPEKQPVLVVVTSRKLHFLKIAGIPSEQPEKWLVKESSFPLNQLCCVMTVIGNQGLVLQFDKEGSVQLYLALLRDERRTKNVLHFLLGTFDKLGMRLLLVDMMPIQWLAMDGLIRGDADTCSTDDEVAKAVEESDMKTSLFLLCSSSCVEWKDQKACDDNAAVIVANDQVALIRGDPRWLLSNNIQFRTWGVSLLSVQQVVNLVSLESYVSRPEELKLYFLDEASSLEEQWTITLATREAVDQLVEAVRNPWEAIFSVELEINELDE